MRILACTLAALALVTPARAADMDVLRGPDVELPLPPPVQTIGPATYTRWSGFYLGANVGYANANGNFSDAPVSGIAYALRDTALLAAFNPSIWPVLGIANNSVATYGGFVGYNTQWQDLVVGLELDASRASFKLNAPSTPIGPLVTAADPAGLSHTVTIVSAGTLTNMDIGTVRARAGYIVGSFMPYGFVGAAFALSSVAVSAFIHDDQCSIATPPVCTPLAFSNSFSRNSEFLYGYTIGGGIDWAVLPNVFLRAEFEWDQFNPPPGILLTVATGRIGAGVKF